jgi:hypothetical protein
MLASDLSHPHSSESSERLVFRSDCDVILLYLFDSSCLFFYFLVRAYNNLLIWKKMNCVWVGVADSIGTSKSLGPRFFKKIGSQDRFSRFLYKTCWLLRGVNFLDMTDDRSLTGSSSMFSTGEVYEEVKGTDRGTETNPEPLVISEGSVWTSCMAEPVGVPGAALPCGVGSPFSGALRV